MADQFADYVLERLSVLGPVRRARFFSGTGYSLDGVQFAVLLRGALYFKVDDETRPRYAAAGMQPFSYGKKDRRVTIQRFYELPEDVLADDDDLRAWAREAIAVERKKKPKKSKKRGPSDQVRG